MPVYRITVDALDVNVLDPVTGEEGLQSLSFFASTSHDIFAEANQLRHRLDCSSCRATRFAVARGLLEEESAVPAFGIVK